MCEAVSRTIIERERRVLERFVAVFCRKHHDTNGTGMCAECRDLLDYAFGRLEKCPYDPKPKCKDCETHCYRPQYRDKIRAVMRFSGIYFVQRGRLDWLVRYFM